jgi:hypothetical protein
LLDGHYTLQSRLIFHQERWASDCGSSAGIALRLRSAKRSSPLSAPLSRSPTADRSQRIRSSGQGDDPLIVDRFILIFQSLIEELGAIRLVVGTAR